MISGFKSFADKVTLTLDRNAITGIVGPNGSGKSNVIDAVRWVMGEQNAKMLRGEKSTDIIFSGSEKRKGQSLAEVSLVFDNAESSLFCPPEYRHETEIALTRRIYLNGEREYFINRKPSRLRDLVGFFTSSGLGGRSYSMIQQGQVDHILQAKPEDLREILEEASNTSIFKKRKEETLKKLEQTKLNLSRLQDILQEVERQLVGLSGQVEKAKKWIFLTEEIKKTELSVLKFLFLAQSKRQKDANALLGEEKTKELVLESQKNQFESQLALLKERLQEADPELAYLNESLAVLREKLAAHESTFLNTIKFIENQTGLLLRTEESFKEESLLLEEQRKKQDKILSDLDQVRSQLKDLASSEEELTGLLDIHKEEALIYERNLSGLKEESIRLDKQLALEEIQKDSFDKSFHRAELEEKEQALALASFEQDSSEGKILLEAAQIKASSCQKHLDELIKQKHVKEGECKELKLKRKVLEEKHHQNRSQLMETEALRRSLEEILASATDARSAALFLGEQPNFKDRIFCLSHILSFESSYTELPKGVIRAFEYWIERLVLDKGINLGLLSQFALDENLPPVSCSLGKGPGSETQDPKLKPLWPMLKTNNTWLKQTEFLQSLFWTEEADPKPQPGVVIFSALGAVLESSQHFTLGVSPLEGSLSKKQKLIQAEEKTLHLDSKVRETGEKLLRLDEKISALEEETSNLEKLIHNQNKSVLLTYGEYQELKHKFYNFEDKTASLRKKMEEARKNYEHFFQKRKESQKKESDLRQLLHSTKKAIDEAYLDGEDILCLQEERKRQLERVHLDRTSSVERERFLNESYGSTRQQIASLEIKLQRQKSEREDWIQAQEQSKKEKQNLEIEIKDLLEEKEEIERQLSQRKDSTLTLTQELKVCEKALQDAGLFLQKNQKIQHDLLIEIERSQIGLKSALDQAQEKYGLPLSEWAWSPPEHFRVDQCQMALNQLKAEYDQLGPVNSVALDEHEELTQRRDFILAQKEEIDSAIDLLETAIEEIEEKSTKKFMDMFHLLNKEFQEIFPILFPRGEALLQLTEGPPLDAGVEIMVRLPGKARQNMRLFSGGEKALTAIALIFALLKSKPTPFCFLDEVDAPLDETNVGRYNELLEALSHRFQFIVITHRRKTMEVLDTLYGVTMQEPGVSKAVGVDLGKALPTHLQKAFTEKTNPVPQIHL